MANNTEKNNRGIDQQVVLRGVGAIAEVEKHTTGVVDEALALNRTVEMIVWGIKLREKVKSGKMKIEELPYRGLALINIVKAIEESGYPPFLLKKMFIDTARNGNDNLHELGRKTKLLHDSRKLLESNGFELSQNDVDALKVIDLVGMGCFPRDITERALGYTYNARSNPVRGHRGHIVADGTPHRIGLRDKR